MLYVLQAPTLGTKHIDNLSRPPRSPVHDSSIPLAALGLLFTLPIPAISALPVPQLSQNQHFQENFNFLHLAHAPAFELY
jgi:hypothetical protein